MLGGKLGATLALSFFAAALCWPATAPATTVILGDPAPPTALGNSTGCSMGCTPGFTLAQSFSTDGDIVFAPAPGLIKSWRVAGDGTVELSVLESGEEGWVNVATSAPAANLKGGQNSVELPVGFDDMIGVTFPTGSPGLNSVGEGELIGAEVLGWRPELTVDDTPREPSFSEHDQRLQYGAEEILAPVLSAISPLSGATSGGNAVTITGKYLDGATAVTFGATTAPSFSVESSTRITAIAPASVPSTVDVRVAGPGGSSEVTAADRYTFTAPTTPPVGSPVSTGPPPATNSIKLVLGAFTQSAAKWRRGTAMPRISSTAVGTTFSFTLNEAAGARLLFTRSAPGRRVKGRCVAVTGGDVHKPHCKLASSAGSFSLSGHAGTNKVRFQGGLNDHAILKPGTYAVAVGARDSRGQQALTPSLTFTILSG